MKTQSTQNAFHLRDCLGSDDDLATTLAEHGHGFPAQARLWPAEDDADAELRRAVAYRHGCVLVDKYLVGPRADVGLVQCAQSYDFFQATVAFHVMASKKRFTKPERAHATLMTAQAVTARAATLFGAKVAAMRVVAEAFDSMGVECRLPRLEPLVPRNAKEAAVFAAVTRAIDEVCDRIDEAPAQPDPVTSRAVKAGAPYLRLVK